MSNSATPWTVTHQAPPSMGFSRQEYWSGLPFGGTKFKTETMSFSKMFTIYVASLYVEGKNVNKHFTAQGVKRNKYIEGLKLHLVKSRSVSYQSGPG